MTEMTIVNIQRHENVPYMTVEDCFFANAERHRANGDKHLAEGRPEYALGSYRKAEKNEKKANQTLFYRGSWA